MVHLHSNHHPHHRQTNMSSIHFCITIAMIATYHYEYDNIKSRYSKINPLLLLNWFLVGNHRGIRRPFASNGQLSKLSAIPSSQNLFHFLHGHLINGGAAAAVFGQRWGCFPMVSP